MGGRNEDGQYVADWQEHPVWARRESLGSSERQVAGGDVLPIRVVNWNIRWMAVLENLDLRRLEVRDDLGQVWQPEAVNDSDERRRFMAIQCIETQA